MRHRIFNHVVKRSDLLITGGSQIDQRICEIVRPEGTPPLRRSDDYQLDVSYQDCKATGRYIVSVAFSLPGSDNEAIKLFERDKHHGHPVKGDAYLSRRQANRIRPLLPNARHAHSPA